MIQKCEASIRKFIIEFDKELRIRLVKIHMKKKINMKYKVFKKRKRVKIILKNKVSDVYYSSNSPELNHIIHTLSILEVIISK